MVDSENTRLYPLAVLDGKGNLLRLSFSSEKALKKSRESGELWFVNPDSGRVLPLEDIGNLIEINLERSAVVARVAAAGKAAGETPIGPGAPDHVPAAPEAPDRAPGKASTDPATAGRSPSGGVLPELEAIIASRQREMKEGSYTTYLFEKGIEKIRKKTGEEAIELLLTTERNETVSEAADLIYHLLVLLRALDIPLDEVLAELRKRLQR